MTLIETPTGRPRAFSDVLVLLASRSEAKLCLGEIVEAFGERAFGPVMFFFALINMLPWPPGGTTLTGAPLLLLSIELALGRDRLWIPRWAERISVDRATLRKLSGRFIRPLRWTEAVSRPRPFVLTGGFGQGDSAGRSVGLGVTRPGRRERRQHGSLEGVTMGGGAHDRPSSCRREAMRNEQRPRG